MTQFTQNNLKIGVNWLKEWHWIDIIFLFLLNLLAEYKIPSLFPLKVKKYVNSKVSDKIKKLADTWINFKNSSDVMIDDHDHYHVFISLACVSSETHDLQRVFRPGAGGEGIPSHRLYKYVQRSAKGHGFFVFLHFWFDIGYQFRPFWSEIGFGLCTLVLNWVCFLEEATSSSFGDRTISLFMFTPTVYVP